MGNENDETAEVRNIIRNIVKEEMGSSKESIKGDSSNLGELGKMVNTLKGLNDALRSDIDKAINQHVSERIVQQVIPSLSSPPSKTSFLDSGFAQQLGAKIPETIPVIIDVLATRLGPDRAGKIIDGVQQKFLGGGSGGSGESGNKNMPIQNIDELILSFNPEEPSHLHHYMAIRNFNDADIARKTLVSEREKLINKLKTSGSINISGSGINLSGSGGSSFAGNEGLEKQIEQQNEILKFLIDNTQENKKVMSKMIDEINNLKTQKEYSNIQTEKQFGRDVRNVQETQEIRKEFDENEQIIPENYEIDENEQNLASSKMKVRIKKNPMIEKVKEKEKEKEREIIDIKQNKKSISEEKKEETITHVELSEDEAGEPVFK